MGGELRIWANSFDLPNLDDQLQHLRCGVHDGPGCEMMEGYAMSFQGSVTPSLENVKRTEEVALGCRCSILPGILSFYTCG